MLSNQSHHTKQTNLSREKRYTLRPSSLNSLRKTANILIYERCRSNITKRVPGCGQHFQTLHCVESKRLPADLIRWSTEGNHQNKLKPIRLECLFSEPIRSKTFPRFLFHLSNWRKPSLRLLIGWFNHCGLVIGVVVALVLLRRVFLY